MDILFTKWWLLVLIRPLENGLIKNCASEQEFINDITKVVKVLKTILYDKKIDELPYVSKKLNDFVLSKK